MHTDTYTEKHLSAASQKSAGASYMHLICETRDAHLQSAAGNIAFQTCVIAPEMAHLTS